MAKSGEELQQLLEILQQGLDRVGLKIILNKSFTFAWIKDRENKKRIYDDRSDIKCNNVYFVRNPVNTTFTYLGAKITPSGLCKIDLTTLDNKIDILLRSPTKPQQKLFILKNFLLPSFYHKFIFSKQYASYLKQIDVSIRKAVRKILHLPHDLPKAPFHAKVAVGAWGFLPYVISFQW